jgi:hypothetical protein
MNTGLAKTRGKTWQIDSKNWSRRKNLMRVRIGPYRKNRAEKIEIEPFDTWSMDSTLALIVHPMLVQLKDTTHGAPNVDDEDVPEKLRSTNGPPKENHYDTDAYWFDRWDWALDEMIWAFHQKVKDDWQDEYYGPYIEKENELGEFEWFDSEGMKAHQKRMSNGFRLFGKYYENLWD